MSFTNQPAERRQADGKQAEYSDLAKIWFDKDDPASRDTTRQEFKDDADINKLLGRYGIGPVQQRQTVYGEVDYDLDLQTAMRAVNEAYEAYRRMPRTLREKYPSWQSVLNGLKSGQFKIDLENKDTPPPVQPDLPVVS